MNARRIAAAAALFAIVTVSAYAQLPRRQSFDSNGVEIKYFAIGEGTPVLLIHGYTASALTNWPMIMPRLARDYFVIAPDNRGHGASEKPIGAEHYGDEMIRDSIRLLDHLGIEKAHIVGYSMGGFITAKMATMYPERMLSATIGGAGWAKNPAVREAMLTEVAEGLEEQENLMPLLENLSAKHNDMPRRRKRLINRMMLMTNDPDALASVARGMITHTVTEAELRAVDIPVQVVVGEFDPIKKAADNWAAVRPQDRYVILEDKNHMTTVRSPEFFGNIREFLALQEELRIE